MAKFKILKSASFHLDEIYLYTINRWGKKQAENYILGIFDKFQSIADRKTHWNIIPPEFRVRGYYTNYKKHFIYFKEITSNEIAIISIMHQSMDRANKLKLDI